MDEKTNEAQQIIYDVLGEVYRASKANPRKHMNKIEASILEYLADAYAKGSLNDHLIEEMGYFPIPAEEGGEGYEHIESAYHDLYSNFLSTYVAKYVLLKQEKEEEHRFELERWVPEPETPSPPAAPSMPPFIEWLHKNIALNYIKARNQAEIATAFLVGDLGAISKAQAARNLDVSGTTIDGWIERGRRKIKHAYLPEQLWEEE